LSYYGVRQLFILFFHCFMPFLYPNLMLPQTSVPSPGLQPSGMLGAGQPWVQPPSSQGQLGWPTYSLVGYPPGTTVSCSLVTPGQGGNQAQKENNKDHMSPSDLKLAGWQMLKIAAAVFLLRAGFHLAPKGLAFLLKATESQTRRLSGKPVLNRFGQQVGKLTQFLESWNREHGSSLYKSLMAIVDGCMMLYVGGQVDRYFCKKNNNFKPDTPKDPEKVVDKVLLVLVSTERMEALMHHLFHWLDSKPTAGRQFMYGELAALSAVLMDTIVKIASDRYRLKKKAAAAHGQGGQSPPQPPQPSAPTLPVANGSSPPRFGAFA
jgi:hypothetical protein